MGKFETHCESQITCPYCGYKDNDSWKMGEINGDKVECNFCKKTFYATTGISIIYSTRANCELNNETHDFRLSQWHPDFDTKVCTQCAEEIYPANDSSLWTKKSGKERVYVEGSYRSCLDRL